MMRFLSLFLLFSSSCALGGYFDETRFQRGFATLGNLTQFRGAMQTSTSGETNSFDIRPYLGLGFDFFVNDQTSIVPELSVTIPETLSDGSATVTIFTARGDWAFIPWSDEIRFLVGTSLVWTNITGSGGSVQGTNGGSAQTFYFPEESRSSFNNTLDLGAEYFFHPKWSTRLQTIWYSPFDNERTQMSYTISINFSWEAKK